MVSLINPFFLTITVIIVVFQWPLTSCQTRQLIDYSRCDEDRVYCMGSTNGCIEQANCDLFLFVETRNQADGGPRFKFYILERSFPTEFSWNYLYFSTNRTPGHRHEGKYNYTLNRYRRTLIIFFLARLAHILWFALYPC